MTPARRALLAVVIVVVAGLGACNCNTNGHFDGGVEPDGGGPDPITAAQIGTVCTYDDRTGENPTNQCAGGLTCMIVTHDRVFTTRLTLDAWEDFFTIYHDDGHVDEGYCTRVGTWAAPPACPDGTRLKFFSTDVAVCLRECASAVQCGRQGYVCDTRYFDDPEVNNPLADQPSFCVKACTLDVPECVRSGVLPVGDQGALVTYLAAPDLQGGSVCNQSTGLCTANEEHGTAGPGEPCLKTFDCLPSLTCLQGQLLGTGAGSEGFCGALCKPDVDPARSCTPGYVCQAGFLLGYPGDPVDGTVGDGLGVPLLDPDNGGFSEGGGFCFPACQTDPGVCASFEHTSCGSASFAAFQQPWNQVPMCLLPALRD